jgi:acyl-CoA thioesterase FadM
MAAYQREIPVRFGHCDPATFVFYPRYFEMINSFVEDWFEDGLEASFPGLCTTRASWPRPCISRSIFQNLHGSAIA